MALQQLHVQKIQRKQFNGDIQIIVKAEQQAIDGPLYSIFEQARNTFICNAAKQVGSFDLHNEHNQIIAATENHLAGKIEFASFCQWLAKLLEQQMLPTEEPFTWVFLCAIERAAEQQYLYLLCLNEEDVVCLDNYLEPIMQQRILTKSLPFGLRLAIDEWQQNEDENSYLQALFQRGNKIFSDAFLRFSSFVQRIDNSKQTNDFLNVVEHYSQQLPNEQAQATKSAILDYCLKQDKNGQTIAIDTLSSAINEQSPQDFSAFYQQNAPTQHEEIHPHRASLKRYMRYSGRDHSLSISFSAERIDKDIVYDPISGSLHIKQLPKTLKQQLSGFAENDTKNR